MNRRFYRAANTGGLASAVACCTIYIFFVLVAETDPDRGALSRFFRRLTPFPLPLVPESVVRRPRERSLRGHIFRTVSIQAGFPRGKEACPLCKARYKRRA